MKMRTVRSRIRDIGSGKSVSMAGTPRHESARPLFVKGLLEQPQFDIQRLAVRCDHPLRVVIEKSVEAVEHLPRLGDAPGRGARLALDLGIALGEMACRGQVEGQ